MTDAAPAAAAAGTPTIAARLNRLPITRTHRVAVAVVGLGLFFDVYEIFLAGTLSAVLRQDFGLGADQLKAVLASAFVGQFLGAILLGRLADRVGRRRAFLLNIAIYSGFSVVCGLAPNAEILIAARFLAGVGIGAELALADTYLSDLLPARHRGRYVAVAYTISFLGVPACGFLARWLVPLSPLGIEGWRWMFLLGGIGAALVWIARRGLPESPRWLEAVGRTDEGVGIVERMEEEALRSLPHGETLPPPRLDEAPVSGDRLPFRLLFRPPYARRTMMLWVLNVLEVFGYYGFGALAPLILVAKGYSIVTSLTFASLTYIGYPVGSALSLPIIERFERKWLLVWSALGMGAFGLAFGYSTSSTTIIVAGFCYTLVSNIFSNAFHVYQAELYPTRARATASGAAYAMSRLSTAALPYILIPVLDTHGSGAVFAVVAAALVLLALDVGLFGPRTTGRSLEEVNVEVGAAEPAVGDATGRVPTPRGQSDSELGSQTGPPR
jgi:MFS transporter, putative metabolite:H+ symporter